MKLLLWISYLIFFLKELFFSSIMVAKAVLFPKNRVKPAFVALPLDLKSDLGITILANTITLTPGTFSVDVSEDKKTLYIHTIYLDAQHVDKFKKDMKENFEKKVIRLVES